MASISVSVDGKEHTVDLAADSMTLREHRTLQAQAGNVNYDTFIRSGAIVVRPDFLEAYLYAKLKTVLPDLDPESIDVDFVALVEAFKALDEVDEGKA